MAQLTDPVPVSLAGFGARGPLVGGAVLERENPARTDQVVGRLVATPVDVVLDSVADAASAQRGWAELDHADRAAALRTGARSVADAAAELAPLLARELGKPLADSAGEMAFAAAWSDWVADHVEACCATTALDDADGRLEVRRVPHGVVAAIVPWNAPLILSMLKVAPALATGNSIVVKPSPVAPFAVTASLQLLSTHLPPGVLSVVHGGADVGDALVGHRDVAKVAFTGGEQVATAVLHRCAETITPTVLELGGNDAALVLDDLTFDDATMERLVFGAFLTSGQVCMAAKRLLVPAPRAAEFVDAFVAAAERVLVCGDPLEPGVTVGPVATPAQRQRVLGLVDDARRRAATVVDLGVTTAAWDPGRGYFVRPTLVLGLAADAPLVTEEQFGPTVPLVTYEHLDEAVALVNGDELGLASSVWSDDEERAFATARRLRAGTTFVNCHNRAGMSLRAPFGGVARSGWGREFGTEGIVEYTRTHAIHHPGAVRDPVRRASTRADAYPTPAAAPESHGTTSRP